MSKQNKNRLGRGLGNLIAGGVVKPMVVEPANSKGVASSSKTRETTPSTKETVATAPEPQVPDSPFLDVRVSDILPNPYQPRKEVDTELIAQLAESIRSEGLLQPIIVRPLKNKRFELIAGERRWRANQYLGLRTITARSMDASDSSSAVISLIENLQREGLNAIEEAMGYASLMGDFDLTQEAVAERVGKGRASIANTLRLLQLDKEIQSYVTKGQLSVGHAKVILGIHEPEQRILIARRVIELGSSVRETEQMLKSLKNGQARPEVTKKTLPEAELTIINDLEKQISSQLNTRVTLKHTAKKGRIIIEYHGNEDLQRILEKTGLQS